MNMNTFVNILARAALLILILFCVFFIIYPHACQNFSMGHWEPDVPHEQAPPAVNLVTPAAREAAAGNMDIYVSDNPFATLNTEGMTQDEYDYMVVQRYVELEARYSAKHPNDKDSSVVIAGEVMREAGLEEEDWQEILAKATANNWFAIARRELAAAQ